MRDGFVQEGSLDSTLAGVLESQAAALGDKPFLYFEDRTISFAQLDSQVNRVANGLVRLGVGPGIGVAIMMPNSPEWLFVYFATQKLGAFAVPVNVALKGESLRHVLDHSDAALLVTHPAYLPAVRALLDECPKIHQVVVDTTESEGAVEDGAGADRLEGSMTLAELMQAPDTPPLVSIDPLAISALLYTSGTTGSPKGVVNRYGGLNLDGIRLLGSMMKPDDVFYTCLPLFHANALFLTTARALVLGVPMVLARRFSASRFWDDMRRFGVTTFNALGAMIPILMKQPERDDDRDNPVRVVFSAACPASVWADFEERFAVQIIEGYAAVDGGGFAIVNFGQSPKGSMGKPFSPVRVVDEHGNDVGVGEPGELLFEVDDPEARKVEYYKNAAAGDDKIRNGWLYTGDLVHADEFGNLYFVDRKTDSVRRRGENISSWEVERELNRHPKVLECAVFGVPSELGEDDVMAVIVVQPGETLSPDEIIVHAQERLAAFMVPRYIELRDELPKTETHRVQKSELKRSGVGPDTWDREDARVRR